MESTNKRTSRKSRPDVYRIITDRIISLLDKGTIPWRKTWKGDQAPKNLVTNKCYRGVNVWLLVCAGFGSPYWLTFNQAKQLGGKVKKGEKATPVVFWKIFDKEETVDGVTKKRNIFLLRYYNVFNLEQTEDVKVPKGRISDPDEHGGWLDIEANRKPIEAADAIFADYIEREGIRVTYGGGRASYNPKLDTIRLPLQEDFETAEAFQATRFHEAGHSTGSERRLNRPGIAAFDFYGSHQYADEELVAEFSASFLCSSVGIEHDRQIENAAAYIAGWRKKLNEDPKIIVQAAQRAQKASDLILGVTKEKTSNETEEATA